jgi:PHD/YefM family antitoxin component YafN of YafNO toxin-antitoxin module
MTVLDVSTVRETFAETVNRVSYGSERVAIRRHGKIMAGIVSAEDLALLEAINAQDVKEARAALAKAKAKGEKPLAWTEAKKQLGL